MRALIYIYIPNTQTTPTTHSSTFIHISIHPSIHTHLCNAMVFLFYLSSSPFHFSFLLLLPFLPFLAFNFSVLCVSYLFFARFPFPVLPRNAHPRYDDDKPPIPFSQKFPSSCRPPARNPKSYPYPSSF